MREPSMANVVKSNTAEFHQGRGFHASSTVNLPIRPRRGNETVPRNTSFTPAQGLTEHRQRRLLLLLLFLFHERGQRLGLLVEPRDFLEQRRDHLVFLDVANRHPALEDDA